MVTIAVQFLCLYLLDMSLFSAILRSDYETVRRLIDSMGNSRELNIELNMTIGNNPPMTLYDIAVEQNKEEGSKASKDIMEYLASKGAMTYEQLMKTYPPERVSPLVPLYVKSVRTRPINKGIASLPRRTTVSLGKGGYRRNKTRSRAKRVPNKTQRHSRLTNNNPIRPSI